VERVLDLPRGLDPYPYPYPYPYHYPAPYQTLDDHVPYLFHLFRFDPCPIPDSGRGSSPCSVYVHRGDRGVGFESAFSSWETEDLLSVPSTFHGSLHSEDSLPSEPQSCIRQSSFRACHDMRIRHRD